VATGKVYVVEDADTSSTPEGPRAEFPETLQCLIDALDAAAYRSAADTPKAIVIVGGKQRQPVRRFEGGKEVWSASFSDRTARSRSATPACAVHTCSHGRARRRVGGLSDHFAAYDLFRASPQTGAIPSPRTTRPCQGAREGPRLHCSWAMLRVKLAATSVGVSSRRSRIWHHCPRG
jgi:hypothetical protein